jgi:hypothetical protein
MDLEKPERQSVNTLDALGPAPRAELLHVLMLRDFDRADAIGEFWSYPQSRAFARAADRLRGERGFPGGAGRDAAGDGRLTN